MNRFLCLLFFLCTALFAKDYDVVVVGTSPICLFEALYYHQNGKSVAIFEQAAECGGAWKAIDVCGVAHADLGCHQIGSDRTLANFLEVYAGCKLVWLDHPKADLEQKKYAGNGLYFSKGCFELIDHLVRMIQKTDIDLFNRCTVNDVTLDMEEQWAVLRCGDRSHRAKKVYCTPASSFTINNSATKSPSKYYHAYLLLADPEPPRFSYRYHGKCGISRAMNLTYFVDLENTGTHLIVLQLHGEKDFGKEEEWLKDFREKNLISSFAYLIRSENHIYEQAHSMHSTVASMSPEQKKFFEVLNTASFHGMTSYLSKWKGSLKTYAEMMD